MGSESLSKQFIFNEKMDQETLYSLYTDDFDYIEEIFGTTLQHFDADFNNVQSAYENGNIDDLRKAVHKIKPTFGYAGLLQTQLHCKDFEDRCTHAVAISDMAEAYIQIKTELLEAKDIIQTEYTRLKAFNAKPL